MKLLKNLLLIILSIGLGITFLYSAYTKLNPIQSFEYTLVEYAHLPWTLAAIAARFFIGLEAALGFLLLFNIYGKKKWVLKASLALLVILSSYLIYLWSAFGNDVNCGCFGDSIWMSPSTSLLKNAALILCTTLLLLFYKGIQKKWASIISLIILPVVIILPYILFALPDQEPTWLQKDKFEIDLSSLYNPALSTTPPPIDLRKGKYVIAFMSLSCPHCRVAAHKMHIMKEKNPELPFFLVVGGLDENLKPFWKETGAESIPHTKLDSDTFTGLVGYKWPAIYWVNNSWVETETNYITMNQGEIEKWLKK